MAVADPRCWCALGALLLACVAPARAQVVAEDTGTAPAEPEVAPLAPARPSLAGRIVKVFDFEERSFNPLPVPLGWYRGQSDPARGRQRPGYPVFNGAVLDYASPAVSGAGTVRLPTSGGSTALLLSTGTVSVFPSADYMVTAAVRTENLTHARARVTARLLDQEGDPIAGAESVSAPIRTGRQWQVLGVPVLGDFEQAAFLQLELSLVQPEIYAIDGDRGQFDIWPQDYDGAAWFDDVMIIQIPRIEMTTHQPANIVLRPRRPKLDLFLRDLTGERLLASMSVVDVDGRLVASEEFYPVGGRLQTSWTPDLDRLGWYRATMRVTNEGQHVGAAVLDFAWIDPASASNLGEASPDRRRFGVMPGALPDELIPRVADIVAALGAGSVTLPAWRDSDRPADVAERVDRYTPVIEELVDDEREVTLALTRIPEALADASTVDPDDVLDLMTLARERWADYIEPMLDRFGQRVRRWQLGAVGDERPFRLADRAGVVDLVDEALSRLVPGPVIALPWAADQAFDAQLAEDRRSLVVPLGFAGDALEVIAEDWHEALAGVEPLPGEEPHFTLVFEPMDHQTFGPGVSTAEMARRAVRFWAAFMPMMDESEQRGWASIALTDPWRWVRVRRPQAVPTPEAVAWQRLIDHLAGRRLVGELAVEGGRAYIFGPAPGVSSARGGVLVAWSDGPVAEPARLGIFLGRGDLLAYDLWGNARPVSLESVGELGLPMHAIELARQPVFVEGVDVELALFHAGLRLDPPMIVSRAAAQQHELVVANPWPVPIRGELFVVEPGGFSNPATRAERSWDIQPRVARFVIDPGDEVRIPVTVGFSAAEIAGDKPFIVDVDLIADEAYGLVRIVKSVELGLPEVSLTLDYTTQPSEVRSAGPGERDIAVLAEIVNRSDQPLTLELLSAAPGQPRRKATVDALAPGESAVRSFPYPAAFSALEGNSVAVGLRIIGDDSRLTKTIEIR